MAAVYSLLQIFFTQIRVKQEACYLENKKQESTDYKLALRLKTALKSLWQF